MVFKYWRKRWLWWWWCYHRTIQLWSLMMIFTSCTTIWISLLPFVPCFVIYYLFRNWFTGFFFLSLFQFDYDEIWRYIRYVGRTRFEYVLNLIIIDQRFWLWFRFYFFYTDLITTPSKLFMCSRLGYLPWPSISDNKKANSPRYNDIYGK